MPRSSRAPDPSGSAGNAMNWEAVGAVGEIAGALAVVVTLLFLSRRIRETAKQINLNSATEANSLFNEAFDPIYNSCRSASWRRRSSATTTALAPRSQRGRTVESTRSSRKRGVVVACRGTGDQESGSSARLQMSA